MSDETAIVCPPPCRRDVAARWTDREAGDCPTRSQRIGRNRSVVPVLPDFDEVGPRGQRRGGDQREVSAPVVVVEGDQRAVGLEQPHLGVSARTGGFNPEVAGSVAAYDDFRPVRVALHVDGPELRLAVSDRLGRGGQVVRFAGIGRQDRQRKGRIDDGFHAPGRCHDAAGGTHEPAVSAHAPIGANAVAARLYAPLHDLAPSEIGILAHPDEEIDVGGHLLRVGAKFAGIHVLAYLHPDFPVRSVEGRVVIPPRLGKREFRGGRLAFAIGLDPLAIRSKKHRALVNGLGLAGRFAQPNDETDVQFGRQRREFRDHLVEIGRQLDLGHSVLGPQFIPMKAILGRHDDFGAGACRHADLGR